MDVGDARVGADARDERVVGAKDFHEMPAACVLLEMADRHPRAPRDIGKRRRNRTVLLGRNELEHVGVFDVYLDRRLGRGLRRLRFGRHSAGGNEAGDGDLDGDVVHVLGRIGLSDR